jgi:hypothetical protein
MVEGIITEIETKQLIEEIMDDSMRRKERKLGPRKVKQWSWPAKMGGIAAGSLGLEKPVIDYRLADLYAVWDASPEARKLIAHHMPELAAAKRIYGRIQDSDEIEDVISMICM